MITFRKKLVVGTLAAAASVLSGIAGYGVTQAQKVPVLEERIGNLEQTARERLETIDKNIRLRLDNIDKNLDLLLRLHLSNSIHGEQAPQSTATADKKRKD